MSDAMSNICWSSGHYAGSEGQGRDGILSVHGHIWLVRS